MGLRPKFSSYYIFHFASDIFKEIEWYRNKRILFEDFSENVPLLLSISQIWWYPLVSKFSTYVFDQ